MKSLWDEIVREQSREPRRAGTVCRGKSAHVSNQPQNIRKNSMKMHKTIALLMAVAMLIAGSGFVVSAHGAVYQFQEGVSNGLVSATGYNVADASMRRDTPSVNYGSADNLTETINLRAGLLQFDVSAAAGPGVAAANLTLTVSGGFSGGNPATFTLYALPSGNTNWLENTATYANQNETGPIPWKLSNGSDAPSDYALFTAAAAPPFGSGGQVIGSWTGAEPAIDGQKIVFNLDTVVVSQWVNNPSQNTGFLVWFSTPSNSGNGNFYSSESTTASFRPLLEIYPIPEPGTVMLLGIGGAVLWLRRRQ